MFDKTAAGCLCAKIRQTACIASDKWIYLRSFKESLQLPSCFLTFFFATAFPNENA